METERTYARLQGPALAEMLINLHVYEVSALQKKLDKAQPKGKGKGKDKDKGVVSTQQIKAGVGFKRPRKPVYLSPYAGATLARASGRDGVSVRWELGQDIQTPGEVWAYADELIPALQAANPDEPLLVGELPDKPGLWLQVPGAQPVAMLADRYDEDDVHPRSPRAIRLEPEHRAALEDCLPFASEDREALNGVWVDADNNVAFATDGHRLRGRRFDCGGVKGSFFVPRPLAGVLRQASVDAIWLQSWESPTAGEVVAVSGMNFHLSQRSSWQMPNYRGVANVRGAQQTTISTGQLREELARWKRLRPERVILQIDTDGSVRLHLAGGYEWAGRIVLDGALKSAAPPETVWAAVDLPLLLEHLQSAGEDLVVQSWIVKEPQQTHVKRHAMFISGDPSSVWTLTMGMTHIGEAPDNWTQTPVAPAEVAHDDDDCDDAGDDSDEASVPEEADPNQTSFGE